MRIFSSRKSNISTRKQIAVIEITAGMGIGNILISIYRHWLMAP